MSDSQRPIRVLFNDSHANLPNSTLIPQGGPSRFSQFFTTYFEHTVRDIELSSLLFSHNDTDARIYRRETLRHRLYQEIVYPGKKLTRSYTRVYTKAAYIKFLAPWLTLVGEALDRAQPDIVFLNGYSLSNWMILHEASKRNIPICVQLAGIWKKEIWAVRHRFSPSIRRIFASFEKDIIQKASSQIFLNEFSRDTFFTEHATALTPDMRARTAVIPLPIMMETPVRAMHLEKQPMQRVATIARWDLIKNHHAVMRLAVHAHKMHAPFSVLSITKWAETPKTELKRRYSDFVQVIPPMLPNKLHAFYDSIDIGIVLSRFETASMVLMEAILSGKPVVISDSIGWVSDYKQFGLDDFVVRPAASGKVLVETLTHLIQERHTYLPRFQKLQKKILREHTPEKVFKAYYKIFTNLAKSYAK